MKTPRKQTAENYIKEIRINTRRIFSSEQKIQIVIEALRAETSVAELCRKYSINESQFYKWNKEFLEAGKKRLSGDTTREATSDEVADLKKENQRLKVMALVCVSSENSPNFRNFVYICIGLALALRLHF